MNQNNSPWLHQLKITRPIDTLYNDTKTNVAIIGAGISGVMTAYFTLKNTDKKVLLVEGNRIAHGSTGHNAGQVVAMFERKFHDIVREFGLEKAAEGERALHSAWVLLDEIFQEANLTTPISSFMGYSGYSNVDLLTDELKNNTLRKAAGISTNIIYIAEHLKKNLNIPEEYRSLYELVPHKDILNLLETDDNQYVAVVSQKTAAVNSALLVYEIVGYLIEKYKDRFQLAEHTSVEEVLMDKDSVTLNTKTNRKDGSDTHAYTVTCEKVVLCTNGFERVKLKNISGMDVDTKFHQNIQGAVGYMSGFLEELNRPPVGLSYYDTYFAKHHQGKDVFNEAPYFYVTRRPYEIEKNEKHNLVCIGGPEVLVGDTRNYIRDSAFDDRMSDAIGRFIDRTYKKISGEHFQFKFQWHGLLCYTPNGIRLVGPEPKNKNLYYNLGCNGIGIIPSIYGGMKISKMLAGEKFPSSIFDPKDL